MRGRQPGLQAGSVVGGLAEAATGPPGRASAWRGSGQSLTPEHEHRDARSGGCGFELAILNQGNTPANEAPPPPDLASLPQMELANQSRFNCGSLLGCEPGVGTGNSLGLLSMRNDPRGPCIAASFTL